MNTEGAIERFLESPGLSASTRRAYRFDVAEFGAWLEKRGRALDSVDVPLLAAYAAELGASRPGRVPRKLAPATMARKMAAVRAFLRFSLGKGRVPDMPLGLSKGRRLPDAPAAPEIEQMLERLDGDAPLQLRNRALVELVYSAGLRASEAVGLDLADVDFEQESVHVQGKGGKERVVPLGEEASYRLQRYLRDGRPKLVAFGWACS